MSEYSPQGPLRPHGFSQVHFLPEPEKADLLISKQADAGLFIQRPDGTQVELKADPTCYAVAVQGDDVWGLVRFRSTEGKPFVFAIGFCDHVQTNKFHHNGLAAAFGQFMAEWSGVADTILVRPGLSKLIEAEGGQA